MREFVLLSNSSGKRYSLKHAPINWDAGKINFLRDVDYFGVFKSLTSEFFFVKDGFQKLYEEFTKYGENLDLMLRVYDNRKHIYTAKVNFDPYEVDLVRRTFKADLIESSFVQKFHTRNEIGLSLLNERSIDGIPIRPANVEIADVRGDILKFYTETKGMGDLNPQYYHHIVPFEIVQNENPQFHDVYDVNTTDDAGYLFNLAHFTNGFYHNNKGVTQELKFNITIGIRFTWEGIEGQVPGLGTPKTNNICQLLLHRVNSANVFQEALIFNPGLNSIRFTGFYGYWENSYELEVTLQDGDYLVCAMGRQRGAGGLITLNQALMDGPYKTKIEYEKFDIQLTELSEFRDTETKCFLPLEVAENLVAQMTGKDMAVQSKIFGRIDRGYLTDGEAAYDSLTKGKLLRGFDLDETDLSLDFKTFFKSYSASYCLGMVITKDVVYIDRIEDLIDKVNVIDLGEVSNLKITEAKDYLFNSVKAGCPNFVFEEVNGIDEFQGEVIYNNDLIPFKKELDIVSPIYLHGKGVEFVRRKQKSTHGTEDTRYDNLWYRVRMVRDGARLKTERLEALTGPPTGILSPETAMNLYLAPSQCIKRWSAYLGIPVHKTSKVYQYQSKEFNSELALTTKFGGNYTLLDDTLFTKANNGTFEDTAGTWDVASGNYSFERVTSPVFEGTGACRSYNFSGAPINGNYGYIIPGLVFPANKRARVIRFTGALNLKANRHYIINIKIRTEGYPWPGIPDTIDFPFGVRVSGTVVNQSYIYQMATDIVDTWKDIRIEFDSELNQLVDLEIAGYWIDLADTGINRMVGGEIFIDQINVFETIFEENDTIGGYSKEGEDIEILNRLLVPEMAHFDKPLTREILRRLQENPLQLIRFEHKKKTYFHLLYEVNAEDELRLGNWKTLALNSMFAGKKELDLNELSIVKYGDGEDDFVKYGDGENDVVLYE